MRLAGLVLVVGIALGLSWADQDGKTVQPPIRPTPVGAGDEMYLSYCASCHGRDARGAGPVVPALKRPAPDLTTLAKRNAGKFPSARVKATIRGEQMVTAHGSKDMPVWGPLFRYLGGGSRAEVNVRIDNLTRYIESLQEAGR
ncbi:MAG: cytochrome c [Acidobacteriia bacterium]|nr:cytochrome c [Terriglobia bacterium]